jgi:hypothetical protein
MIEQYIESVSHVLGSVLDLFTRLALPLAVCLGLMALAGALTLAFQRDNAWLQRLDWRRYGANLFGVAVVGLIMVMGWAALSAIQPLAQQDIQWRESAEATANPVPDAPPVYQYGPVVAALVEHTYTRTLTLPPDFLQRIGAEGVSVLSPYLSDPSAEDVIRLMDTFRRSGRDVVFTRQVTRRDEEPIPFATSQIRVSFRRLSGRAYDADFEGRYTFQNVRAEPITARFLFPLPDGSTVRDLSVSVGGQMVAEPNESGAYEWKNQMNPGERREAVVRYRVLGARTWRYDLGSRRRRVQQFRLDAVPGGPVRFLRGSLQPTASANGALRWELANVVTAQQVAIALPPDTEGQECYLQALSALPASFVLFLIGALAVGVKFRQKLCPGSLAGGLVLFAFGLGASSVMANYLGSVAGLILGPLAGALLAARVLGWRSLLAALPAALLPATFLSPRHTGLLVLLLTVLVLASVLLTSRSDERIT